jgi:hypothetical protein
MKDGLLSGTKIMKERRAKAGISIYEKNIMKLKRKQCDLKISSRIFLQKLP